MKDEETGLEIYSIPNAETLAAMKKADEIANDHSARFSSAEELPKNSLEKDQTTAFGVHWRDGLYRLYRTREQAVRECNGANEVVEICMRTGCFYIV